MTATTATATELGIRLSADRFYAARAEGRYRVIDGDLIDARTDGDAPGSAYVATCASRAKAEAKAAALNEAAAVAAAEDALTAAVNRGDEAGADNARAELAELDLPTTTEEFTATVMGILSGDAAPAAKPVKPVEKLAAVVAAKKAAKKAATEDTRAYRIGKVLREFVLTQVTPADSELAAHITGRNVCYDGTATLRLTAAWTEELSGFATALENAVMADTAAAGRAPAIMAARSAQKSLAKLF